jgi:phosphoribosylamine---glycine ligase
MLFLNGIITLNMNILILGSGGREHAIAWKLAQSKKSVKLFVAPGNAGTLQMAQNIDLDPMDFEAVKNTVLTNKIDILIVGPEAPLVKGIRDFFESDDLLTGIPVVGPCSKGAMLEGSKDFAKAFMVRNNIPTARYNTFTCDTINEAELFLKTLQPPYVLKADGLAAGKGVLILDNYDEADRELGEILGGRFGTAGNKVVIEEYLTGIEASVFIITDGKSYKILPEAKDYKRIGEGDTGKNTGGMGAVSPVPFVTPEFMNRVEKRIIIPTMDGLKKEDIDYKGFIFFGLMNVAGDPYLIEYNARMGDPETEVVMPRIKSDFLDLIEGVAEGNLDVRHYETEKDAAVTVMMVSGGYPDDYKKGKQISGLENTGGSIVFHAGTKVENGLVVSAGGRVLSVTSLGETRDIALAKSYKTAEGIHFDGSYFRRDIGLDLK